MRVEGLGQEFGEVTSGEWRVTSLKKKQIPRCARNDNLWGFRRAVGRVVWPGRVVEPDPHRCEDRPVLAEMRVIAAAGSAATAAVRESKRTRGHAVLCTERGHRSLLKVEFWDC